MRHLYQLQPDGPGLFSLAAGLSLLAGSFVSIGQDGAGRFGVVRSRYTVYLAFNPG